MKKWFAFIAAGALFHFAVEGFVAGMAILIGAILVDIGVDEVLLAVEKRRGKVD